MHNLYVFFYIHANGRSENTRTAERLQCSDILMHRHREDIESRLNRVIAPAAGTIGPAKLQFQVVQLAWRSIARTSAECCIGPDGEVDIDQAWSLLEYWRSVTPEVSPFNSIPGIELVREQIIAVLENLIQPSGRDALTLVEKINALSKEPSPFAVRILHQMGYEGPFHNSFVTMAVLQSLFTPHRQLPLPTCSIDALIIADLFDHQENLVGIYHQILTLEPADEPAQIVFPVSGNQIDLLPLDVDERLVVAVCDQGRESMSEGFSSLIQDSSTTPLTYCSVLPDTYQTYGIGVKKWPTTSPDEKVSLEFNFVAHDLNDVFFANLMHATFSRHNLSRVFIEVRRIYFGTPGDKLDFGGAISRLPTVNRSLPNVRFFSQKSMSGLQAKAQSLLGTNPGRRYATVFVQGDLARRSEGLTASNGHLLNLDLRILASLDLTAIPLRSMKQMLAQVKKPLTFSSKENFCIIGDSDGVSEGGYPVYLGVAKTTGPGACLLFMFELVYQTDVNSWRVCLPPKPIGWMGFHVEPT
ncbi:MAG: hypothetical protein LBF25_00225 [Puniceicoccales bacterium]|nr:hypothetical protein [Puniceicoccales bacterium]